MKRGSEWLLLVWGVLSTGCLDLEHIHVDREGFDLGDASDIDLSKGIHTVSPWFGYEVVGRVGYRTLVFHLEEEGRRETLGAMPVDGLWTSVNQREAAYAVSEDGRTLVYLHLLPGEGPAGKKPGLYRHVVGEGDQLVREGVVAISCWLMIPFSLQRNAMAYAQESDSVPFSFPAYLDPLCKADICSTDGKQAPLLAFGGNALHAAALEDDVPSTREALAHGEDTELRGVYGQTPLLLAVALGRAEVARRLIEGGADIDATWVLRGIDTGMTALHLSVMFTDERAPFDVLLDAGANPNAVDLDGATPLRILIGSLPTYLTPFSDPEDDGAAVRADTLTRIERLLDAGANPEIRDSDGNSLLHLAASQGDPAVVQMLLRHGASPHARDRREATPLHYARLRETAEILLAHGANPAARDERGRLPKILADWKRETVIQP